MASRLTVPGVLLVILCAALISGCCPGGVSVLESLTLPIEEQEDCSLVPAVWLTHGPAAAAPTNPIATSDPEMIAAIAPSVTGSKDERVKSVYSAVYECEHGGPQVRVYAVVFDEPTDSVRAATLDMYSAGVMFKGQLAGIVVADDGACESCYDVIRAHAETVLGK